MEPSTYHPLPGSVVSVGLRVGQDFLGDPVRRQSRFITRFAILQGRGEEAISGADNIDPAGLFEAVGEKSALIVYAGGGAAIELPADRFEEYLKQNGLEAIITERVRLGEQARAGHERFYRNAKTILAAPLKDERVLQPAGLRYEIVPLNDPTVLAPPREMAPVTSSTTEETAAVGGLDVAVDPVKAQGGAMSPASEGKVSIAGTPQSGPVGQPQSPMTGKATENEARGAPLESPILQARVLFEGRPLAGVQVEAIARDNPQARRVLISDADGEVRIPLAASGPWLIRSVYMLRGGWFSDVDWESHWTSLTFEVPEGRR